MSAELSTTSSPMLYNVIAFSVVGGLVLYAPMQLVLGWIAARRQMNRMGVAQDQIPEWLPIPDALTDRGFALKQISESGATPFERFALWGLPRFGAALLAGCIGFGWVAGAGRWGHLTGVELLPIAEALLWLAVTGTHYWWFERILRRGRPTPHVVHASYFTASPVQWDAECQMNGMRLQVRFGDQRHAQQLRFTQVASDLEKTLHWQAMVTQADKVFVHGPGYAVIERKSLSGSGETLTPENWQRLVRRKHVLQVLAEALVVSKTTKRLVAPLLCYPHETLIYVTPMLDHLKALNNIAFANGTNKPGNQVSARDLAALADKEWDSLFSQAKLHGICDHQAFATRTEFVSA